MSLNSKKPRKRSPLRIVGFGAIVIFALIGFILTTLFFAVKLHITNDPGAVDFNDRYFQEIKDKYGKSNYQDTNKMAIREAVMFSQIVALSKYYPENALNILNAFYKSHNLSETERMVDIVNLHMQDNKEYSSDIEEIKKDAKIERKQKFSGSVFFWMNIAEWSDFKIAVAKDKALIDSVANLTRVEPRLIVAVLVGEQIRLFNSDREAYKRWIGPLKILSVESTFSLGVTGIKATTAEVIEKNLKDSLSVFYLGPQYSHLLDFRSDSIESERFKKLTDFKNHFYSYLYAALNVKQIMMQWERSGFTIADRPEILATLFNIGFDGSIPKANPMVGGSTILIRDVPYTFGAIAFEFYYSGELYDAFPFKSVKFDWKNN